MSKQNRIQTKVKLACATLILSLGSLNYNFDRHNTQIASASLEPIAIDSEAIAKKKGGRSGGGSFKRKSPSSSQRRKPSRNQNKRKSPSYNREPSRRQNERSTPSYRREPSRSYRRERSTVRDRSRVRTYRRGRSSTAPTWLVLVFFIIILLVILLIIYLLFLALKNLLKNAKKQSRTNKLNRERDNDRVTVSMLQVALLTPDSLQTDLSTLSTNTDTDTDTGLVTLMQESALALLRHEAAWTHVRAKSDSLNIDRAESVFNRLSTIQRSKFTGESLTNIDGSLQIKEDNKYSNNEFAQYVVVTMIVGTADDKPLFTKINTEAELKEQLLQFASTRDDYLFKFELLWTPQKSGEYLTDEELLLEYTDIIPLA